MFFCCKVQFHSMHTPLVTFELYLQSRLDNYKIALIFKLSVFPEYQDNLKRLNAKIILVLYDT